MTREGAIHLPFSYSAGVAASRFLVALRDDGRILGAPCAACGKVSCPARSFCSRCGEATAELVEVGPAGTLVSFTQRPDGEVLGLVRLDGADTAMLHRLLGAQRWALGARVAARLRAERRGSITDIEGFERLAEEERR